MVYFTSIMFLVLVCILSIVISSVYMDDYTSIIKIVDNPSSSIKERVERKSLKEIRKQYRAANKKRTEKEFYIYYNRRERSKNQIVAAGPIMYNEHKEGKYILISTENYNEHLLKLNPLNNIYPNGTYVARKYMFEDYIDIEMDIDDGTITNMAEKIERLIANSNKRLEYNSISPNQIIMNTVNAYRKSGHYTVLLNINSYTKSVTMECIPSHYITHIIRYML